MQYPRFYLKVFNEKGDIVKSTDRYGKRGIKAVITRFRARIGYKYWVKVVYGIGELANPLVKGRKEPIDNEGTYDTKQQAIDAYEQFTSNAQIDQVRKLFALK